MAADGRESTQLIKQCKLPGCKYHCPEEQVRQTLKGSIKHTTPNDFGDKITKMVDATGKALKYTVNKTMMRVELPTVLKPGQKFVFKLIGTIIFLIVKNKVDVVVMNIFLKMATIFLQ